MIGRQHVAVAPTLSSITPYLVQTKMVDSMSEKKEKNNLNEIKSTDKKELRK